MAAPPPPFLTLNASRAHSVLTQPTFYQATVAEQGNALAAYLAIMDTSPINWPATHRMRADQNITYGFVREPAEDLFKQLFGQHTQLNLAENEVLMALTGTYTYFQTADEEAGLQAGAVELYRDASDAMCDPSSDYAHPLNLRYWQYIMLNPTRRGKEHALQAYIDENVAAGTTNEPTFGFKKRADRRNHRAWLDDCTGAFIVNGAFGRLTMV